MKCRKCKKYLIDGDYEDFVVHNKSSHGVGISDSVAILRAIVDVQYINEDRIKELIDAHNETGKAGADKFKKQ